MPSEALKRRALEALGDRVESFRSAVAEAVDELRVLLERQRTPAGARGATAAAELGAFASQRIDADRFASLFEGGDVLVVGEPGATGSSEALLVGTGPAN